MARPVKRRRICELPKVRSFLPDVNRQAGCVEMAVDEYETIRLIDHLGLSQEECALQMNVARTTVQAIYDCARKKLADALVTGKRLEIGGGTYEVCAQATQCCGKDCSGVSRQDCCIQRQSCQCCCRKKKSEEQGSDEH